MSNSIKKVIDLIKRTGDKCIILDSEGEPAYVAMSFKDYEGLTLGNPNVADLSEDEFLGKINRDIATWKASQDEEKVENWSSLNEVIEEMKKPKIIPEIEENSLNQAEKEENQDKYYFEPIE